MQAEGLQRVGPPAGQVLARREASEGSPGCPDGVGRVPACRLSGQERVAIATHRQYITDDALYQGYITTVEAPMSFHTFMKIKQWMRVRHVGEIIQLTEEKEQCEQHQQLSFRSAINTS